jgi:hypothetical protein
LKTLAAAAILAGLAGADAQRFCTGEPNSVGPGASIRWAGPYDPDGGHLMVEGCPPGAFGTFLYGIGAQDVPFGDGRLCVGYPAYILARARTDAQGRASLDISADGETEDLRWLEYAHDMTWYFQFGYRDLNGPGGTGFNLTDALEVVFEES